MISVVIFTRDDAEWLARCLGGLEQGAGEPLDIIVFDNASSDGTAELVRGWSGPDGPAALLRATEDTSFSRGNNLGLAAARGDLTLFLNPDAVVDPATLDAAAAAARARGGLVGPRLLWEDGTHQSNGWALPTPAQLVREKALGAPREVPARGAGLTPVGWLMGCFLMGRTADLRAAGGFDERYWFLGTDLEICARLGAARLDDHAILHRGHRAWTPERRRATRQATLQWLTRSLRGRR